MSCRLKDYYKEGIPFEKSIDIVLGILDNVQSSVSRVRKDYTTENLIARNLESLGLLIKTHPPASPEVTPRGGTLVLSKRPYLITKIVNPEVHAKIRRFILLKAIRDSDWECFKRFYTGPYIEFFDAIKNREKGIRNIIRKKYYSQYKEGNFNHWYMLHLSFIRETDAENILQLDDSLIESKFSLLNPYSEKFSIKEFFGHNYRISTLSDIEEIIQEAIAIYVENLSSGSSIGYCETLKTIIQILLLNSNMFVNELDLSDYAIEYMRKHGVGFMRSNYPILTGGRGFIDRKRVDPVSFILFHLPSSYFR